MLQLVSAFLLQGRSVGQVSSAGKKSATNIKNDITGTGGRDLMSREEEYKYVFFK